MSNKNNCVVCDKSLANKRPHAKTCSGACRTKLCRLSKAHPVSVKIVLSKIQFDLLKSDADLAGVPVNELVIARSTQPSTYSLYT